MALSSRIDKIAQALVEAYRSGQAIDAVPEAGPQDAAAAYAVQAAVWRALAGDIRPSAWKVAMPAPDVPPICAPILPGRLAFKAGTFPPGAFRTLAVEAEIALRFGQDLPARSAPYPRDEILAAVASAHVAMELVETRLADPEVAGPFWRLADSLLNGGLVLGDPIVDWRNLELGLLNARTEANGRIFAEARGRQPQGDIFAGLPGWIAQIGGVCAGDIVTTGSWNGAPKVTTPAEVRVTFAGLGMASAQFA